MIDIIKVYDLKESSLIDTDNLKSKVNGICVFNDDNSLYIPFSLCIVIADALTFNDEKVSTQYEIAGYIEIYYDYDGSVVLSDGTESVRIMKSEIDDFAKQLWDLI